MNRIENLVKVSTEHNRLTDMTIIYPYVNRAFIYIITISLFKNEMNKNKCKRQTEYFCGHQLL